MATVKPAAELILAKMNVPRPRTEILPRHRLIDRLVASSQPVVVVRAPAGYGKSTVLEQWASVDERQFAWVSLDSSESDPVLFWRYVFGALRRSQPGLAEHAFHRLEGSAPDLLGSVVPGLLNALGEIDEPVVLVLDDYHRLDATAVAESLESFVHHVPELVTVALASRTQPEISLAGMHSRGQVLEITREELRLGLDETVAEMAILSPDRTSEEVLRIHEFTEGWAAGVYLASITTRAAPPSRIHDYLVAEMLNNLTEEDRAFMRMTSILADLVPDLCDHVVGSDTSAGRLKRLGASNLLLIRLDETGHQFRYHHLLQDVLQAELTATDDRDTLRLLHHNAYDWYARHSRVSEAIHHAIQADAREDAVALVCGNWYEFMMSGRLATAQRWLSWFSEADIRAHPPIFVTGALVNGFAGDDVAARRFARMADAASHDGDPLDGSATYASSVALMHAGLVLDGPADGLVHVARAAEIEPEGSPFRPVVAAMLGVYRYMTGAKSGYYPLLIEAAQAETGPPAIAAYALGNLALIHAWREEWEPAAQYAHEAVSLSEDQNTRGLVISGLAYAVAALVASSRGDAEEARRFLEIADRIEQDAPDSTPFDSLVFRTSMAEALVSLGEYGRGEAVVGRALRNLAAMGDGGLAGDRLDLVIRHLNRTRQNGVPRNEDSRAETGSVLSTRELQVLSLLATDLTLKEIGSQLYLSRNTVKTYANRTYRKLSAHSRHEAVAAGRALGYL